MFEKLKRKSLRKSIDKHLEERDVSQVNSVVKTVAFLVDESVFQDLESLYEFSNFLELQRKDVKVFTFQEVKKKMPSLRQNHINNKEFDWKGQIHNQNAAEFLETSFDVLIGYYKGNHDFLDAMVSRSNAKFKVGFSDADERLYDLLIAVDVHKPNDFKLELKKYLTVLNKL